MAAATGGGKLTVRSPRVNGWALLVLPALFLVAAFYALPVADILSRSVTDFNPPEVRGADNYRWFFDSPVNVTVLQRTFVTAGIVTGVCLLLGYPYAYLLTLAGRKAKLVLLALVLVPFWTSLMVRNYAWIVLLQPNGPINSALDALGLGRTHLLGTRTAVTIGMSQVLLPFVVLPLYARLRTIDRRLLLAAESLGASPWKALLRVYLPLSLPGVIAAGLLAFVLALGFYITPALLGSPQQALLSQLLVTQVNQLLAWGHGGAMAAVLLAATLLLLAILAVVGRRALQRTEGSSVAPGAADLEEGRRTPARIALWIVAGFTALILVAPTLVVLPMSLTGAKTFAFPPPSWSTVWFEELFSNPIWYEALLRSLGIALVVTLLATVLGTAAALGLSRGRIRGVALLNGLFLAPMIVPIAIAAVGVYALFLKWKLTGTFQGFVLAHTALAIPFVIVPVSSTLRGFDRRLEHAAASLGARPFGAFRRVTLPLILPGVLTGAVFAFATSLDETVVSLFLVSPTFETLPVQMFTSVTREIDPTVAAASATLLIFTSLVVVLLLLYQVRRQPEER